METNFNRTLYAHNNGFSLHAAVRCAADDQQAREKLCGYITRPTLVSECVRTNAAGQVVLKPKTPWRDGTTHLVMMPLVFTQRHIDGQLCCIEFCERYVSKESASDTRVSDLTPGKLTPKLSDGIADVRGRH